MKHELDQAALLKRFEPALKFTLGERFYPYNIEDYINRASLWEKPPNLPAVEIIPEENLDLARFGAIAPVSLDHIQFLQFISPINLGEMAEFRFNELREALRTKDFQTTRSRLARVGYLARFADTLFSLLLLMRGRVPGDTMAAAVITFNKMLADKRAFQYYGRVIQQSGWLILQYWYFYPFNDWRSGFYGANDHEADWEMVNIYCYQDALGEVYPAWVGYACHNYSGDDLRRHWDDPELEKVGEHPVVYVGGGSHASYFQNGEYLTQLSLPFFRPMRRFFRQVESIIGFLFRENNRHQHDAQKKDQMFTIPFVDYALGDGLSIGPGCEETWGDPVVIDPKPAWVENYRGLWGYYTQDPFSGEDAPAGPRYNRDGNIRQAWYDPLGWAGMEKVVPPNIQNEMIAGRKTAIQSEIDDLDAEIHQLQTVHFQRGIDYAAIRDVPHLQNKAEEIAKILEEERETLSERRFELNNKRELLESIGSYAEEMDTKIQQSIRSHIMQAHQPYVKKTLRLDWFAEVWAAISIGIMMIAVVLLVIFVPQFLLIGLVGMLLLMITIEAGFRRRLSGLVRWVSILFALIGFVILMIEFFYFILLTILMIIGFYMIIGNLREMFARH